MKHAKLEDDLQFGYVNIEATGTYRWVHVFKSTIIKTIDII